MDKVLVIVQARMASRRLPGKVLIELEGKPLILHTIEQLRKSRAADNVVLATSDRHSDDPVSSLCSDNGIECVRGPEEDVLKRFIIAADRFKPMLVVRICGDEPLFDPAILDESIRQHKEAQADYSTTIGQVPNGMDVEIIDYRILKKLDSLAELQPHREHVTKYIIDNPDDFRILRIDFGERLTRPDIKLTVDTREDFLYVQEIMRKIVGPISADKIIALVDSGEVKRKEIIMIRADGSKKKGFGDLITTMAIAQRLRDDFEFIYAVKDHPQSVRFLKTKGYEVVPLPKDNKNVEDMDIIRGLMKKRSVQYSIIELVPQDPDFLREISSLMETMVIDFFGGFEVWSKIILRWDLDASEKDYGFKKNTIKLFGPGFVPISAGIISSAGNRKKDINDLRKVIVSFGATDAFNLSRKVLDVILSEGLDYEFTFILGPGYRDYRSFEERVNRAEKKNLKIMQYPDDIYKVFQSADLVISAGGFTAFELAYLGVPFIGMSEASWERKRLALMEKEGICRFIRSDIRKGLPKQLRVLENTKVRKAMSDRAKTLVDGKGMDRIAEIMLREWKR